MNDPAWSFKCPLVFLDANSLCVNVNVNEMDNRMNVNVKHIKTQIIVKLNWLINNLTLAITGAQNFIAANQLCIYIVFFVRCMRVRHRCGDRSQVFSESTFNEWSFEPTTKHLSLSHSVCVRMLNSTYNCIAFTVLLWCLSEHSDVEMPSQPTAIHIRIHTLATCDYAYANALNSFNERATHSSNPLYTCMRVEAELKSHLQSHHHEMTINSAQHVCYAVNMSIRNAQSTQYTTCFTMRCINISTRPTHHSFHSIGGSAVAAASVEEWSIFLASPGSVYGRVLCVGEM